MIRGIIVISLACGISAIAQRPPLSVVRGRVVADDSSAAPIRGARVELVGTTATATPVYTDGEGRFALGVPVSYTLKITKAGFAPALPTQQAMSPGELQVRLSRGGVLTGRVADGLGFPAIAAGVRARRLDPPAGAAAAGLVEFRTETDDSGEYRIGSLPPGRYAVHSEPRFPFFDNLEHMRSEIDLVRLQEMSRVRLPTMPISDIVDVELRGPEEAVATLAYIGRAVSPADAAIGGAITGSVFDEFGDPAEGIAVRPWRVSWVNGRTIAEPIGAPRLTDDRGQYRLFHLRPGRYLVVATDDEGQHTPVYYPGQTTIANAAPIVVRPSQEVPGIHMAFTRVPGARVSGVALNASGQPLQGHVSLSSTRRVGEIGSPLRAVRAGAGGAFEFAGVPPGDYVLRATRADDGMALVREFGLHVLTVDAAGIDPVTVATRRTARLAGRFVIEGPRGDLSPADFRLIPTFDPDNGPLGDRFPAATIRNDWTFELQGLAGAARFVLAEAPRGWWLKSMTIGITNAAQDPVRFTGADDSQSDVIVVVADSAATVTGRVVDEQRQPVDDYLVLVFAADRDQWFNGSPYVRITGGPDPDGGFSVPSLPPGDYWAAAVDAIDGDAAAGEWQNPDVLNNLSTRGSRVSVREGERAAIELRLIRWAR